MSGKPSTAFVQEFSYLLKGMATTSELMSKLTKEIEVRQLELKQAAVDYNKARERIFKLMAEMDIQANHNTGYDVRMTWFLIELYKQLKEE